MWVTAGAEFSLRLIHATSPPYPPPPSPAGLERPSWHAMREAVTILLLQPRGHHPCCAESRPSLSRTNLSPNTLYLNQRSLNQRIEILLCTHKLDAPDLAHLALKPFALLIRHLVGTRNHQA